MNDRKPAKRAQAVDCSSLRRMWKINKDLMEACVSGDLEQVKNLVARDADVNFKEEKMGYGRDDPDRFDYPIEQAAQADSLEIIKFLVESGADPNINNNSVLYSAVVGKNDDMVDYLLTKFTPDVNKNYSPLINYAVRYPSYSTLDALQKAGISLEDSMPMSEALRIDDVNMVRYLLNNGIRLIKPNIKWILRNKRSELTDLIFSEGFKLLDEDDIVDIEDTDILDYLFSLEEFNQRFNQENLLYQSVNNGKIDRLKYLLNKRNYIYDQLIQIVDDLYLSLTYEPGKDKEKALNFLEKYTENIERESKIIKDLVNRDVYSVIKKFI